MQLNRAQSGGPLARETNRSRIKVTVTGGPLEAPNSEELAPGIYATGVRSILTIGLSDELGTPLVEWTIEESNTTLESVPTIHTVESLVTRTTGSDGTIKDFFGANVNFSNYALSPEEARAAVIKQIEARSHWLVEQTLKISSPNKGQVATAVYRRRMSNLENSDPNGNRLPAVNSRGNLVNNFRLTIFPVRVTYPC